MPSAISAGECASKPVKMATSLPRPAPMASVGANRPPGTPDQMASHVATMRSVTYSSGMSTCPSTSARVLA